ncbi:hypothetical protein [Actinomyces sp. ICM54]|jgi:hypothetical protein|uniref:hypothetical protein n=1 Tax=Actinomyces sp. ICM54 TaxID=936549 RepID=UPI00054CEA94|nr:hypothetical protein [Actinomyces sp. ICM54]
MKYDDVMPFLTFLFGIFCMTMWYLEMFSDSRLGRILGTMTKPSLLSKNRSAICAPAFSLFFTDVGVMTLAEQGIIPHALDTPCGYILFFLIPVILIGLLPIKFPRWVYADWQYAKRHGLLDESGNIDQEAWARHHANKEDLW